MHKKTRKLLSLLTALVFMFSLFAAMPPVASAAEVYTISESGGVAPTDYTWDE